MPANNPFYPNPLPRYHFFADLPNFEPITRKHEYEDGGVNFNELSNSPELRWKIIFTGKTVAEAQAIDAHYAEKRISRPFEFIDKNGLLYTDVYYAEKPTPSHQGNRSWVQTREINLVRYPSNLQPTIVDIIAPTTPENLSFSANTLTWTAATDNVTLPTNLIYELEIDEQ